MVHSSRTRKFRMPLRWGGFASTVLLAFALGGCGGDDGAAGAPGAAGKDGKDADPAVIADLQAQLKALTQSANPETCITCHTGESSTARTGADHQKIYADFYQDGVVRVTDMAFATAGTTSTLTFKMTKQGQPFDCRKAAGSPPNGFAIGSYWTAYDGGSKSFPTGRVTLLGTKAWDAASNVCTFTKTGQTAADVARMAGPGIVVIYGVDEITEVNAVKRLSMGKFPFAGVKTVGTVDYSSAAKVSGCESCHTQPYLKHAYIYGQVDGNAATDFYTCKACHVDQGAGGHWDWQILKDDPARYAQISAGSAITDAEKAKYAYKTSLMNDVHMSHAMEFAYPQSMKNCVACHAGKLDVVLAKENFKAETCKSCHAVEGLKTLMGAAAFKHTAMLANPEATDCTICHDGVTAVSLKTIHTGGYDPLIYTSTGVRYSKAFTVKIDSTTVAANKLTIKFSATESPDIAGLSVAGITPTVLVGLYGYNSKDFLVAAHARDAANNRLLEYVVGTTHPRFTTVKAANGSWEVTADLSLWADKIAAGDIKRAEIAVMPELKDAAGRVLGLDAPSRTFDLAKNAFDDTYFKDIVDVAAGCNTCHDQLATTFHSGTRGGNMKVCRICHEVSSEGSHLELQSRSIDSYIHAIHSFQAYDPGNINFADPVESVAYKHHIGSEFPRFGILNCESCHKSGMYNVPNQAKSMPGVLSGTDAVAGRNVGAIPAYVTGPAVRACGGCHRAQEINADDSGSLAILNQHFKTFGYLIENADGVWQAVVTKIMTIFK